MHLSFESLLKLAAADAASLWRTAKRALWLLPFVLVVSLFWYFFKNPTQLGMPKSLGNRGLFGDSFGVLNSLYSGLGFAGLLITIALQQRQLRNQEREIRIQRHTEEVHRFEEKLFRLIDLYERTLSEVQVTRDRVRIQGRDVLQKSTENALKQVRIAKVNSVPHEVQRRYRRGALRDRDRDVLDYLFLQNFRILAFAIHRQGRLTESLKHLLRHLEKGAPEAVLLEPYRNLVSSQLTHVEVSYLFLYALTFPEESELRALLVSSGLVTRMARIQKLQVHRLMYRDMWGIEFEDAKLGLTPFSRARVQELESAEPELLDRFRELGVTPPKPLAGQDLARYSGGSVQDSEPARGRVDAQH